MTSYLSLVLALCAGQVPSGTTYVSPYATYATPNQNTVYQQSVSPAPVYYQAQAQPQHQAPLRSWLHRHFFYHNQNTCTTCADKNHANYQYYTPMSSSLVIVNRNAGGPYYAQPQNIDGAQVVTTPVETTHEESEPPSGNQTESVPVTTEGETSSNLTIDKKYEGKVGHEADYTWVTGHLFYVHADGGKWVVRYALPGEVDKYGGSIVLAPGVEMKNYREGDLVCVYGEILDEGRASPSLGGALYRVNSILLIERSDP
jgi:hypothetical protein